MCQSRGNPCINDEDLIMINSYTLDGYSDGFSGIENHKFGKSVTWDGTKYTLQDTVDLDNYDK